MNSQFRWLTAGESHGKGLVTIVEGVPAGLPLSEDYIAADLARLGRDLGLALLVRKFHQGVLVGDV